MLKFISQYHCVRILQSLVCCKFCCHEKKLQKVQSFTLQSFMSSWNLKKKTIQNITKLLELRSARWGQSSCWSADDQCLQKSFQISVCGQLHLSRCSSARSGVRGFSPVVCVCVALPSRSLLVDRRSHIALSRGVVCVCWNTCGISSDCK